MCVEVGIGWRRMHECFEERWSDVELAKKCGLGSKWRREGIRNVCGKKNYGASGELRAKEIADGSLKIEGRG